MYCFLACASGFVRLGGRRSCGGAVLSLGRSVDTPPPARETTTIAFPPVSPRSLPPAPTWRLPFMRRYLPLAALALLGPAALLAPCLPAADEAPSDIIATLKGHKEAVYGVAFSPD